MRRSGKNHVAFADHRPDFRWEQRRAGARRERTCHRVATSSLKTGQNLNFAITAEYVAKLMQGIGEVRELAKVAPPADRPVQAARAEGFFQRLGVCSTCADADGSWSPTVLEEQVRRAVQERRRSRREKKGSPALRVTPSS